MENSENKKSIIDIAHLNEMTMDDVALKSEVLGLFRQQAEVWTKLLEPENETPNWMVGAHTIKGSARSIGAWGLADICGGAEEAAKSGILSKDEKFMWREQILQALDEAIGEIAIIEHKIAMDSLKS